GGGSIAYQSNRDNVWAVYVYDLATKTETRLTELTQPATDPIYGNGGSLIAYRLEQPDGKIVIMVMQEDGSKPQAISEPADEARSTAWYFDDTLLAYQSDLDGDLDIYVYDFESGKTRKLTDNTVADYAPTWPCGKKDVIFTSDVLGNADIFRAGALPIDALPLDVPESAEQLTGSEATDRSPLGAPTNENAEQGE
ncbi:MAG TPA: hypothetical protein VHO69_11805, partial [Phototrophicaceae bacterium]|nr:hypothetical protein [Phototrophicaceae bacterium]